MTAMCRTVLMAALLAAGFGCEKKHDNSGVQTPNDQPIGAPKAAGRGGESPAGKVR